MFFSLSKLFWALAQPLNALCLLALLGLAVRLFAYRTGQAIMNASLIIILLLGILPVGPFLMTWLERQYPTPSALPDKIEGIILLGGAFESYLTQVSGHLVVNDGIDRALCFAELAKKHPEARLVFSGGPGDIVNPEAMESYDAKRFLGQVGLENRDVVYEDRSRNTWENGIYSKQLLNPKQGENWVVVTSAYHMPRTVGIFEKLGWTIIPYQCDPRTDGRYDLFHRFPSVSGNFSLLNIAIKELIGLAVYYHTDKSAFILPPGRVASENANP